MPKGRAVLEAWAQTKRLSMNIVVKRRPGKRRAVYGNLSWGSEISGEGELTIRVFFLQFIPPNVL